MDKSYRIWSTGPENAYADGKDVPWATQRCKGSATVEAGLRTRRHDCKMVSDHDGACICVCDKMFNEKEEANA